MTKLNLGAGEDHREGYVSVDIRKETNPDVQTDIGDLHMFDDGSVEEIIAVDCLEHKYWEEVPSVLEEWHRVLEEGGTVWIRTPDWEKVSDRDFWESTPFWRTQRRVLGGHDNPYDVHHSLFTKEILEKKLEEAGFENIAIKKSEKPPLHWHLLCRAEKT